MVLPACVLVEVSETAAESNRSSVKRSRSSTLLIIAVGCSFVAAAIVTAVMFSTVRSSLADGPQGTDQAVATLSDSLVVGVGRVAGGPKQWDAYLTAFARLEDDLGRPLSVRLLPDEATVADAFDDGDVDIALVTLSAYLRLESEGTAELIATPVIGGQDRNAAMLVVRDDSAFRSLEDLRGARVVFSTNSIAGEGYATWLLGEFGETPDSFFGEVVRSESQEASFERVSSGEADAAFVPRGDLFGWPQGVFRAVAESPPFGMPPVVARRGLDPELVDLIRTSLTTEGAAPLSAGQGELHGFVAVTAEDFEFARILASHRGGGTAGEESAP